MIRVLLTMRATETRAALTAALTQRGMTVTCADSGEQAIDRFITHSFDVLAVQLNLPGRDGLATIESIRWAPGGTAIATLLMGENDRLLEVIGRRLDVPTTRLDIPTLQLASAIASLRDHERSVIAQVTKETDLSAPALAHIQVEVGAKAPADTPPPKGKAAALTAPATDDWLPSAESESSTSADGPPAEDKPVATERASQDTPEALAQAPTENPEVGTDSNTSETEERPTEPPLVTAKADTQPPRWADRTDVDASPAVEAQQVEAQAAAVSKRARIRGNLVDTPFTELLARLAEQQASGTLMLETVDDPRRRVTGSVAKKLVFFRKGVPVFVRSNLEEECLGQLLLRRGDINRRQLDESLERLERGDGKQGGVLIAMGALTPPTLRDALEGELLHKLLDLFSWETGHFHFTESFAAPPSTVSLEVPLATLIWRGVSEHMRLEQVAYLLGPHRRRFVAPTPRSSAALRSCVGEGGGALLSAIDGTLTTDALLDAGQPSRTAATQILYAAMVLGVVVFRQEAGAVAPRLEPEESPLARTVDELREKLVEGRYAEALQVEPGDRVGAAQAVAEWEDSLRLALSGTLPQGTHAAILDVLARLPRAALSVGTSVDGRSPSALPPTMPLPTVPSRDARPGLLPSLTAALTLSATASATNGEPAPNGDSSDLVLSPSPMSPDSEAGLDIRVDRMLEAERLFRQGQRALEARRLPHALELLSRSVALAPSEGEFLTYLGMARYESALSPSERETALTELERATALVPKMYVAHLFHARALRDEGEFHAARDAFTRALETNPSGIEALDELHDLPSV